MNRLRRRGMQLALMTLGFAGLIVAVNTVPAAATPVAPPGSFRGEVLGHGTLSQGSLKVKPGLDVVVTKNTVDPGGSSGWHSHPGGAIVVVAQGQITTYRSAEADEAGNDGESTCLINTYTAGHSFIETPGEPLNAKNTGSGTAIVYATFPGVPVVNGVTKQRTDEPNPHTCPI